MTTVKTEAELALLRAEADVASIAKFREYQELRRTNPFAAARLRLTELEAVERGQALTQPEPPDAA